MAQTLMDKVAVVTGGGSGGIGQAVGLALAEEGAKVVINDIGRDSEGVYLADKVVAQITASGGTAAANYDSVTTMQGGENIIQTAVSNFGRIDILVNCAANIRGGATVNTTEEDWDAVIDVHLKGHFNCSRAAALHMVKQGNGRIINFSSRGAMGGGSGTVGYSAAKAGILGLTAQMANEFKGNNITVNAILPSADTKLFPYAGRTYKPAGGYPKPISVEPHYIAPMIVFLSTDQAQGITGHFFYVCGGDICIYARPLRLPAETNTLLRKMGKWTVEELGEAIPPLIKPD